MKTKREHYYGLFQVNIEKDKVKISLIRNELIIKINFNSNKSLYANKWRFVSLKQR